VDKLKEQYPDEEKVEEIADAWLRGYTHLKEYASQAALLEDIYDTYNIDPESTIGKQIENTIASARYGQDIIRRMFEDGSLKIALEADPEHFEETFREAYEVAQAKIKAEKY